MAAFMSAGAAVLHSQVEANTLVSDSASSTSLDLSKLNL